MKGDLIRSSIIATGRKYRFIEEEFELEPGRTARIEMIEHPGAVLILPLTDDGELVLIKQYRRAVRAEILELPAGTLEKNEAALPCAQRELAEEIGCSAKEWIELGKLFPAPGFCDEIQHCFLAKGLGEARAEMDEDEIIEPVTLSRKEVELAIRDGRIVDGKTIACFCRALLLGLLPS